MNDVKVDHPETSRLAEFALGRLDPAGMDEVERHVEGCDACARVIRDQPADTLVGLLQARGQAQPAPADTSATPPPAGLAIPSSFVMPRQPAPGEAPTAAGPAANLAEAETQCGPAPAAPGVPGLPPGLVDHPRYRVLAVLGSGGMGAVYLAEHRVMERRVALKVIRPDLVDNPGLLERFHREVKAAARLSHPNIVTAFDAEQAGGMHMLVMEYVEGKDLAHFLADRGPLPANEACHYARQAALGLQHAHERGMVHRDIKPQNLMRLRRGVVKILDFGLARFASEVAARGGLTSQNMILGSVDYMAPEQIADPHAADTRADIYSLGCTLYHLLTGAPPFPTGTLIQKLSAHTERQPKPLAEIRPDLPPGLAHVVGRMLAKDPAARYQTPAEVARALAPFVVPGRGPASGAGEATKAGLPPARLDPRVPLESEDSCLAPGGPRPPVQEFPPGAQDLRKGPVNPQIKETQASRRRHRSGRPPDARRASFPWLLALPLALIGALGVVVRVATDRGELEIETSDPDVRIELKQGGQVVTVFDPKSNQKLVLRSGTYEVGLEGGPAGLAVEPATMTITRGGRVVVAVRHIAPAGGRPAGSGTQSPAEPPTSLPIRVLEGHAGPVRSVSFSPDGRLALSGSGYPAGDRTVRLWEVATGKEVRRFVGHTDLVMSVAFSADGRRAYSSGWDKTVRTWDVETGRELALLAIPQSWVESVTFSADGRLALSGSGGPVLRLWDLESGREVRSFDPSGGPIRKMALSRDGLRAISSNHSEPPLLWDVASGREIRRFGRPETDLEDWAFSPDGRLALSGGQFSVMQLWDVETGTKVRRFVGHEGQVARVTFSPDGRRALSAGHDGTVRLWDVAAGRQIRRFAGHRERVWDVAFSPDGRLALSGGGGDYRDGEAKPGSDWALRLWDVSDAPAPSASFPGKGAEAFRVTFAPDGKAVAVGYINGSVGLLDAATGRQLRTFRGPALPAVGVAVAPDGQSVAASFGDWVRPIDGGGVAVWDAATGRKRFDLPGPTQPVARVVYSPDGRTIAAASRDGTIRTWDAAGGTARIVATRNPRGVFDVAFSPDGKVLASASTDATVVLWDAATGKEQAVLKGHEDEVEAVAFSPDGTYLASGGRDHNIRIWDPATHRLVELIIPGRAGWVTSLAFAPDGRTLASSHDDEGRKFVRLWAIPKGGLGATLDAASHSVTFAPDGRTIATGRMDGTVDLWDVARLLEGAPQAPPASR